MSGKLVVIQGPDKGLELTLPLGQSLQIGRSQAAALRLADPAVSRIHCEIEDGAKGAVLLNVSRQGTLINGNPAAFQQQLRSGDIILIGNTELRYALDKPTEDATQLPALARATNLKPLDNLVGRTLAHYAIEAILARGTTGVVFKARDERDQLPVALKVLQPDFSRSEEDMKRFVRAMKTVMPIRHPHLVAIHGAGKARHLCWIAMEYIEGESLTQVIQRIGVAGMLDWRHAYHVAVHVASALDHAHGRSILHRNVTPRNILLRAGDKSAVLGDLMLAKALEGSLAQQVTKPGEVVGTIAYLAPERTLGTADVDGRADLYGLGATVYALLTGRPPFTDESFVDLIRKIRSAEPEKPKKYQLAIPDLFQGTVLRLLAKRPDDRFPTAAALLDELTRVGKFAGVSVSS